MTAWNILTILSFLLGIFAVWLTYYFWKNPQDRINSQKYLQDGEKITYTFGDTAFGWVVRKLDTNDPMNGKPIKFIADKKNNPKIKRCPQSIEEFKELKFREK